MDKDKFLELSYSEKLKYVSRKKVDPGKVSEPRPRRKITFKSLATQIIGNFNNERKQDIILEIQSITKVNKSRAENGFNNFIYIFFYKTLIVCKIFKAFNKVQKTKKIRFRVMCGNIQ